jgi:VIT1/CCC1 family predicted Fe2+/Mn2+ transporter
MARPISHHPERHLIERIGWLRAAVLGANDGIVSTASLIVGVGAASAPKAQVLLAGVAGLVAGAMSMAAGEFVSVSSQADTERADLAREKRELDEDWQAEREELAGIYVSRGLSPDAAIVTADQLMEHDALGAHARDELGVSEVASARPIQAAVTSAVTFAIGAAMPLIAAALTPESWMVPIVAGSTLAFLAALGALGAYTGGASVAKGSGRVAFWGALAMAATAGAGLLFGAVG